MRYGGYWLVVTVIMSFGKEMAAVENPAFKRFSRDSVCTTHGRMFILICLLDLMPWNTAE